MAVESLVMTPSAVAPVRLEAEVVADARRLLTEARPVIRALDALVALVDAIPALQAKADRLAEAIAEREEAIHRKNALLDDTRKKVEDDILRIRMRRDQTQAAIDRERQQLAQELDAEKASHARVLKELEEAKATAIAAHAEGMGLLDRDFQDRKNEGLRRANEITKEIKFLETRRDELKADLERIRTSLPKLG